MMTIEDKIAVLEAARDRLDDLLVERAEKIANATNALEFSPGEFAKLSADAGAVGDLLYAMYDRHEAELRCTGKAEAA